jgi:hypothetical protein
MHNVHTVCGTVLRTSYTDSDGVTWTSKKFPLPQAAPQHIRTEQVITQPQKLHSQLVELMTAVMYPVTGLTCSFVYGMGVQPAVIIHNNVNGQPTQWSYPVNFNNAISTLEHYLPVKYPASTHTPLRFQQTTAQPTLQVLHWTTLHLKAETTPNNRLLLARSL